MARISSSVAKRKSFFFEGFSCDSVGISGSWYGSLCH